MSRKLNLIQGFIKLYEDYLGKTLKIKKKNSGNFMGMGGLSFLALQFKRKSRTKCPNKIVSLDYNYDFFDDALLFYFWRFDVFFTL